jgi:ornithine cyclodeaminase/alanine dehydrogenase-like protein (mu-crystallin family)
VAVRALGPKTPATVALIGAGRQAVTQALAISRVLEVKELRVFARDPAHRAAFATEQGKRLGIRVTAAPSAEAAVRGADVVVTMTTSSVPVIEASWIGSRTLVVAAGSNFPNRTEVPAELVIMAQSVVVDQREAAQLESGDLIQAVEAGKFDWERATDLASVLTGTWKKPDEPGITLFESHGLALWDLAAASVVVAAARERRLGEELELFWPA